MVSKLLLRLLNVVLLVAGVADGVGNSGIVAASKVVLED